MHRCDSGWGLHFAQAPQSLVRSVAWIASDCRLQSTATGATQALDLPRKPLDWHLHHDNSAILDFFHAPEIRKKLRRVESYDGYMHGDLMAIRTGLCEHHLGTWLNDSRGQHLIHVPIGGTVQRWPIGSPPLAGKVASVWRIIEQ